MIGFANLLAQDAVLAFVFSVLVQCTAVIVGALWAARLLKHNPVARAAVLTTALAAALACPVVTAAMKGFGVTLVRLPLATPAASPEAQPAEAIQTDDSAGKQAPVDAREPGLAVAPGTSEVSPVPPTVAPPERAPVAPGTPAIEASDALAAQAPPERKRVGTADVIRAAVSIGLGVWMLGGALCCVGIARSWWRLGSILRSARPIEAEPVDRAWSQVRRILQADRLPRILSSSKVPCPVVAGVFRPVIILPIGLWRKLGRTELQTVLLHEAAHVVRRDQLVLCFQQLLAAVFWLHPLVHLLNRELVRACDDACDNYVLRTVDGPRYGQTLLRLAKLVPQMQPAAAAIGLLRPRRKLEQRVSALLDERRKTMVRMSVWGLAASGAVMAMLLVVGGGTVVIAQSPPDQPGDVRSPASPKGDVFSEEDRQDHIALALGPSQANEATPGPADVSKGQANPSGDVFDFRGRVVDPEGKPVQGAKLYMIYGIYLYGGPATVPPPEIRAVSDAEGNFRFTMIESEFADAKMGPGGMVVAMADGYGVDFRASYCFDVSGKSVERFKSDPLTYSYVLSRMREADGTLRLVEDDVPLVGRIVDPDGRPVAAATVRVAQIQAAKNDDLTPWLDAVKKGEDYDVTRNFLGSRGIPPVGSPLFWQIMPTATSDADGRFRLTGIGRERMSQLLIEGPDITSEEVYVYTRPGPTFRVPHVLESPTGGTFVYYGAEFEHVARRSIPIVGTVRDKDTGKPLAGVTIRHAGKWKGGLDCTLAHHFIRTRTDEQGRYRLTGIPMGKDNYILAMPRPDWTYLMAQKTADLSEDQDSVQLDFELKRGITIQGRITDARTGQPVRASVRYFVFTDNPHSRSAPSLSGAHVQPVLGLYRTDKDGRYRVPGLPGRGIVAAFALDHTGYPRGAGGDQIAGGDPVGKHRLFRTIPYVCIAENFHAVAEVNPAEDAESLEQDFVLDAKQSLEGTVLDPAGQPLSGAFVHGHNKYPAFSPLTSADFNITLYEPDKPQTLLFVHKDRKLAGGCVLKGPQKSPVTVQLGPWAAITGRVVDAEGKPKANLLILGWASPQRIREEPAYGLLPERHYQTDGQGRFHIEGLVPGMQYEIEVIEEGRRIGQVIFSDLTVKPGETKDLGDLSIPLH